MSLKGTLVLRYNDKLQQYFKLKTKPEPWLHLGYTTSFDKKTGKAATHLAVFVWDTRQIVEYAEANISLPPGGINAKFRARDNGQPLKGNGAKWFNS